MIKERRARIAAAILACLGILGVWMFLEGVLDPYHLPSRDWRLYKKCFLSRDGRIIDTGNGRVSHSEGQGYGMLIAVAYRDRAAFDRIWNWTRKTLQTRPDDKLLSWQWVPDDKGGGSIPDPNNASDGDLLVAWALLRASKQWNEYSYQQQAGQILTDLARLDVKVQDNAAILLPATVGFTRDGGSIINLSYYVFPALRELAQAFPSGPWGKLLASGELLLQNARFGKWKLTPDWVLDGKTCLPAKDFPPLFGYNAVRIPLHLAWGIAEPHLLAPFAEFWVQFPKQAAIPATVNVDTGEYGPHPALPGMQAVAAFAIARFRKQDLTVRAIPNVTKEEPYFSASLKILTKIAICESFAQK